MDWCQALTPTIGSPYRDGSRQVRVGHHAGGWNHSIAQQGILAGNQEEESDQCLLWKGEVHPTPLPANKGLGDGFMPGVGFKIHQTHPVS